ncbi:MAG TPA: S8 family serine peptidase [Longimicrobiales bacterium]
MRRVTSLLALAVFAAACADNPTEPNQELAEFRPALGANVVYGSYIVVLKDDANPRSVAAIMGIRPNHVYETALNGFAAELSGGQLNALRRNPNVDYIEADGIASIPMPRVDARPGGGGGGQTTPWGITRVGGPGGTPSGTAWIIDTGVDLDHPDLNVDASASVNFVTQGADQTGDDGNGHGTHVAGTIAAINNSIDVVGVAPGARVVAVRVLSNSGSGQWSWIIAGIDHVAANGRSGDVANMSLGGPANKAVDDAVARAAAGGVKFVLAAGNDGDNANNHSPARVNGANIYTISAIASNNCLTSWSNYGNPPVDYAAPGSGILSTRKGGGTTTMSGTSMAAPHVAGILLLGGVRADGTACNDPDGNADSIAHR